MRATLADAEARDEIAVIVLNGSDRSFSVGVDVAAHTPEKVSEMLTKFHAVIRAVVGSRKIMVAAVRGHCLGGGAELAMVCDLVYTTEERHLGLSGDQAGMFPPVAVAALAALVGQKRAAELILTGRSISGAEAAGRLDWQIERSPEVNLAGACEETLQHLATLSPAVLNDHQEGDYTRGMRSISTRGWQRRRRSIWRS